MAATFDGVDDCYQLAGETTLRYQYTQPFSGFAWIRKPSVSAFAMMGKAQNSPPGAQQRGWAFNTEISGSQLAISFHLVNNVGSHAFKQAMTPVSGAVVGLQPGLWVPVGFSYDGSGLTSGMTLYAGGNALSTDGTPIDTLGGGTILVNGVPVRLGGFDTEFWAGSMCGVVIVPATLTATEQAWLADIRNVNTNPSTFLGTAPDVWLPLQYSSGSVNLTDMSGNGHDASVGTGAPVAVQDPTVVFDTFKSQSVTTTTSFSVTPVGHVAAVGALIVQSGSALDRISAVTYGGVSLPRVDFAQDTSGEVGAAYSYLLANDVLQGTQSLAVTVSAGSESKVVFVVTVNTSGVANVIAHSIVQGDVDDPSVSLATSASWAGLVLNACFSGLDDPSNLTAGAGYVKLGGGTAFGATSGVAEAGNFEQTPVDSGWVTTGSDDVSMVAMALQSLAALMWVKTL